MRKLIGEDLFKAIRIIRAAGIEKEFKDAVVEVKEQKLNVKQAGVSFVISAVCGCGNEEAEKKIWEFLADLTEMKAEDLKSMDLNDLMDVITKLVEEVGAYEFKSFFKKLSQLMKATSSK